MAYMDKFEKHHIAGTLHHDRKLLYKLITSGLLAAFGLYELGVNLELSFVAVVFVPVAGLVLTYFKLEAENVMRLIGLVAIAMIAAFFVKSILLGVALFILTEATTHKEAVVRYKDVKWLQGAETQESAGQLHNMLESHTLFRKLPKELWEEMAQHCLIVEVAPGDAIIKEGEFNHYLYLLAKGDVNVLKDSVHHASLSSGDFFGEISTMGISLPIADVIASTDVLAFAFSISVINDLALKCPEFADALREFGILRMEQIRVER